MRWVVGVIGASLGASLCAFACSDDPSEQPAPADAATDAVDEVAIDGGNSGLPPGTVALAQGHVNAIAVSATHVYWAEGGPGTTPSGAVRRVPLGGGTAETLATTATFVGCLAVDATSVYFGT